MKNLESPNKLHNNQNGLVSIIVTMIFVSLITVITVSFVLIMRREQRQALDRQLSTQAFYAAESGISDAIAKLKAGSLSDITDCANTESTLYGASSSNLTSDGVIKYSCVLVDQTPTSLEYSAIDTNASTIIPIIGPTGVDRIKSIRISWSDADGGDKFVPTTNTSHFLPQRDTNSTETNNLKAADGTGILRATLIPIQLPLSMADLTNSASTFFLYPKASLTPSTGTTEPYATTIPSGKFIDGGCNIANTPKFCNITIDNLIGTNATSFYLRLKSVHRRAAVTITAYDAFGSVVGLKGAQALVDSTGRANDVLRRLQVRVPIKDSYLYPEFAIGTTDSICKRLSVWPATASGNGGATVDLPASGQPPGGIDYDSFLDYFACSISN